MQELWQHAIQFGISKFKCLRDISFLDMYHLSYTVHRSARDDIKRNIGILLQSILLVVPVGGGGRGCDAQGGGVCDERG